MVDHQALPTPRPRGIHLTLSGKGGVGKSVVARLVAEYLEDQGDTPLCFDADPVNASFAAVPAFGARKVELLNADQKIDSSKFDDMVEDILAAERSIVIDSGAASYLALMSYIEENDIVDLFKTNGFDVYLHTIITGGAAVAFTTQNFVDVAERFGEDASIVVWLNHFWETVERDGKSFTDWRAYAANRDRVDAVIEIPKMSSDTMAADFSAMLKANLSMAEASDPHSSFRIMQRSRLFKIRNAMFEAMAVMSPQSAEEKKAVEAAL